MCLFRYCRCFVGAALSSLLVCSTLLLAQSPTNVPRFPFPEKLSYRIEWHLVNAGQAKFQLSRAHPNHWQVTLDLESAGLVTRLYRVLDSYKVTSTDEFCATDSVLDAQEGKRHRITRLTFQNTRRKVDYEEHDLLKNTTDTKQLDIPPCTREIAGAFSSLRMIDLQPGKSITMPITDGKKVVSAKIEAQDRESLALNGKNYQTIRYEAFLFDNVLYARKGRLFLWVTDDPDRIPIQVRVQLGFPIGTILLQLDKEEKL